jgi:nitroreductase
MADLFDTMDNRTMVREFRETPLKKEEKERILESAIRAPTASGSEQWIFVTVDSEVKRNKLYDLLTEAQKVYFSKMLKKPWSNERIDKWLKDAEAGLFKAPFYVAVFVDLRQRFCTIPRIEELWAHQSVAAAIENMLLAATGLGIGGCWFGVPLLMDNDFSDLLGAKREEMQLAGVLGFGYPKEKKSPRHRKKGLNDVVKSI